MTRPLLPPRGIFVPTWLIFNDDIPSEIFCTWVQLRGLAWGLQETPALSMEQLEQITGCSRSTIFRHMGFLRSRGALRWRSAHKATIICFPVEYRSFPEMGVPADPMPVDSQNAESPSPPPSTNIYTISEEEKREGESANPESRP